MKAELLSLQSWINEFSGTPVCKKEEAASILEIGVATIYRWLKDGNVFIEACDNEDYGCVIVWHMKKCVEA
jgi:hypothetical protein